MVQHLAAAIGSGNDETRMFRNSPRRGAPGAAGAGLWLGDWVVGLGLGVAAVDGAEDAPWAWVVDGGGDATGGQTPWRVTADEENLGMFAMHSFVLASWL